MIHSSWGGTVAEAWTPKANLEANPELKSLVQPENALEAKYKTAEERYKKNLAKWEVAVKKAKEEGEKAPPKPRAPRQPDHDPNHGTVLYNGMIHSAASVCDQGRHLVSGRIQRRPRLPVPHAVSDDDRELARSVEQPRHAVPVRAASAVRQHRQGTAARAPGRNYARRSCSPAKGSKIRRWPSSPMWARSMTFIPSTRSRSALVWPWAP